MTKASPPTGETVSSSDYHHGEEWGPLISSSWLKAGYNHGLAALHNPVEKPVPYDAFALGTAAHTAVLEPEKMDRLVVMPDYGWVKKQDKQDLVAWGRDRGADIDVSMLKDEMQAELYTAIERSGCQLVTAEQLRQATAMAKSVREDPNAMEAFDSNSLIERSYRADGCRARPDIVSGNLLADLKTTAFFDRFSYKARDLLYPESLAHYHHVLDQCGKPVHGWAWIVVGNSAERVDPIDGLERYPVKVVVATDETMRIAMDRHAQMLSACKEAMETGIWPAVVRDVEYL